MMRENVATTSAELNAVPSWNFTPSRSLKVYVLPSGDAFQLSARSGMIVLRPSAGLKRTRLLCIWPRMTRDAPWCTSKCATSAGPAHLSTPPRLGFGSAARARSERTAASAGRRVLQRPRGQRGAGGRSGCGLEETPAIHLAAETGLVHVANPPLGWHAATLRARPTVVNRPRRGTSADHAAERHENEQWWLSVDHQLP